MQWRGFLDAQRRSSAAFAAETADLPTVFVLGLAVPVQSLLFNAAAVVHRGQVLAFVPKEKLPTYNVFYEARTFSRGGPGLALDADGVPLGDHLFAFDFGTVGVEVCEDAWSPDGPMRRRCYSGAEIIVNVSASPYRMGIHDTRREMLATRAADNQTVLVYANAVGAQDGLIFDGGGFIYQNGGSSSKRRASPRATTAAVVDLDRTRRLRAGEHDLARRLRALRCGARPRCRPCASQGPRPTRPASPTRRRQAAASSCPRRRRRRSTPATRPRRSVRGAGARRRDYYDENRGLHARSASRSRAAATRC